MAPGSAPARDRAGAVIHAGTVVGERCVIEDGRCSESARACDRARAPPGGALRALVIADEVTVCCGAVVYAGARIAARVDHRRPDPDPRTLGVGERSVVGRASASTSAPGRRPGPDPDRRLRDRRR